MGLALKKILDDIGDILIKDLRRELKNQEYFASGSLDNSLKTKVKKDGLQIVGNGYGLIINQGLDGSAWSSMPNIEDLREWVRKKGLAKNETEVKQIAYAVGRRIMKDGLPNKKRKSPKLNFIGNVVNKRKNKIAQIVNRTISQSIMFDIKKIKKHSDGKN